MSCKSTNVKQAGSSNPIQDAINPADYSGGGGSDGDNTIESITCDSSVAVGDVVYADSSGTIRSANAISISTSRVVGICTAKDTSTSCNVQTTGYTSTIFSGLIANTNYFLDTVSGQLTSTPPTGSNQVVIHIGRALNNTRLFIQIGIQFVRA